MMYGSKHIRHDLGFLATLDHFCTFKPPDNPENQNFQKIKK